MFSVCRWHQNDTPLYTESYEIARGILGLSQSGLSELEPLFGTIASFWSLGFGEDVSEISELSTIYIFAISSFGIG